MRISPLWTSYLAAKLPCPLSSYSFTRDHIAPKSLFPTAEDPRNILPMPANLNHARGNRPFTSAWKDGLLVRSCEDCPCPGFCAGAAVLGPTGMNPPDVYKGPIARSVLYQMAKYPVLAGKFDKQVLDWQTAIEWDSRFPMTLQEREWIDSLKIKL